MASKGGPNIERDGLVFGFDTGYGVADNSTSTRFYPGEPATNLFTVLGTPSNTDQNVTFSANGTGTFKRVAVGTKIGNYTVKAEDVVYSYALGGNGCHYHGNDYSTVSSGTKVSLNIEYFLSGEVSIVSNYLGNFEQLPGVAGSWGSVNSETNKWHRVSLTRTATGTGNLRMLMYPGACGSSTLSNQGTIYFKNPTVTLTAQPTTFVNGTRSSTQSLIDLTKTTNIDVSNVSFNSDGQPTFDGTNDIINTGLFSGRNPSTSPFTVEAIIKSDVTSGNRMWLDATSNGSNQRFYSALDDGGGNPIGIQGSAWSDSIPSTADYIHQTIVMDGSTARSYRNGVASFTKSYTSYTLAGPITIGGRAGYKWIGQIPVVKIYDRALSAPEVKQNFNAYKNRFNI